MKADMALLYKNELPFTSQQLVENLPIAIYSCDNTGIITYYNKAAALLWEHEPTIGKDRWGMFHHVCRLDGTQLVFEGSPLEKVIQTGIEETEEIMIIRKNGSKFYIQISLLPMFDKNHNVCGSVNTLVDTTDRKHRIELIKEGELLRKSEEKYHMIVDEVTDYAIILLDLDGNVLNWNKGAEQIKGYTEEEAIGMNFRSFYLPEDQIDRLPEKLIGEAIDKGRAKHEGWRVRKDGTTFWGYVVITALHDEQGIIIGFSKVTRDLTEKKLIEDKMQNADDMQKQNKQLEEFAYIASHDLQEPLRKIIMYSGILKDSANDKEKLDFTVDKIHTSANRMSTLIRDVLQYSQLTQSKDLFEKIDLNEIVTGIVEDYELLIQEKGAQLEYSGLGLRKMEGIAIQINQLFSNLISNSLKFTKPHVPALITIKCEKINSRKSKDYTELKEMTEYLKITVQDNGIGFDTQYSEQVFKMFHRLQTQQKGTGIGLALCKRVVDNHHGVINVESEIGVGTTFEIFLPTKQQ